MAAGGSARLRRTGGEDAVMGSPRASRLVVSSTIVGVSPFSTDAAVMLAHRPEGAR